MRGSCQRWVDERWKEASNLEMFVKSSMIFALRLSWLFGGEKRVQHVRVFSVSPEICGPLEITGIFDI